MKSSVALLKRSLRAWSAGIHQERPAGPGWLQWLWTGLFGTMIGLFFTLLGFIFHARGEDWTNWPNWRHWLGVNLFVSLFIAFFIHLLCELVVRLVGRARIATWPPGRRRVVFNVTPLVGVAIGWPLATSLAGRFTRIESDGPNSVNLVLGMLAFVLMFSALVSLYFNGKARAEAAEKREAEARLRLLQGQIEPHFLFNTLANVASLVEADPQRARWMLEAFVDYLRASFAGLRDAQHSLGQELALVEAYLQVLGVRMADRLRWRIEVPADLRELPLPALLLQPLVENAIHHGLEPKIEGGEVLVRAERVGRQLRLEVRDNGLGWPEPGEPPPARSPRAGTGSALANIRARLAHAHGDEASLTLTQHPEGGVSALLVLPVAPAAATRPLSIATAPHHP
ncbi:MAG TPA: histidine kinase [Ideonella sp.]|uniref:sensor histidine kinase n=1 Tax=Ideonella sp. TaxID=1929293 RepID=UPI002C9EBE48|nr:histidine kinase [Ideonella sp.]HSI50440.1 histidine kinase [Ideonella sp.]